MHLLQMPRLQRLLKHRQLHLLRRQKKNQAAGYLQNLNPSNLECRFRAGLTKNQHKKSQGFPGFFYA